MLSFKKPQSELHRKWRMIYFSPSPLTFAFLFEEWFGKALPKVTGKHEVSCFCSSCTPLGEQNQFIRGFSSTGYTNLPVIVLCTSVSVNPRVPLLHCICSQNCGLGLCELGQGIWGWMVQDSCFQICSNPMIPRHPIWISENLYLLSISFL